MSENRVTTSFQDSASTAFNVVTDPRNIDQLDRWMKLAVFGSAALIQFGVLKRLGVKTDSLQRFVDVGKDVRLITLSLFVIPDAVLLAKTVRGERHGMIDKDSWTLTGQNVCFAATSALTLLLALHTWTPVSLGNAAKIETALLATWLAGASFKLYRTADRGQPNSRDGVNDGHKKDVLATIDFAYAATCALGDSERMGSFFGALSGFMGIALQTWYRG